MTPNQNELQRVIEEVNNLTLANQYDEARRIITDALVRWGDSLSLTQQFYFRGGCCRCLYYSGDFEAAQAAIVTLAQERARTGCLDVSYLHEMETLAFVKRGLCEFDESERLLKAVRSQLIGHQDIPEFADFLSKVDREIVMTQAIARGERTPSDIAVPRAADFVGPWGIQNLNVGPLEIPQSQLAISCNVRKFVVSFTSLHAAILDLDFELDNTEGIRTWDSEDTGSLPVLFLIMLPRFGKVHHGKFDLDINGDEEIRRQVSLENHRLVVVHPSSYQPYTRHPIPKCRTFRYAKGDCSTFRTPIPPHARVRFKGEVSFPNGPEEAGERTTLEVGRTLWILFPYGKVDLPVPTVRVEEDIDVTLASTLLARAPFIEDRTGFSPGAYVMDAGETSAPMTAQTMDVPRHGFVQRRLRINDLDFFVVESVLRPLRSVIASFAPTPDVLPLGIFRDIPDARVRNAVGPSEVGTFALNLSGTYSQRPFARVLIENFSAKTMPMHLSVRADELGIAIEQDIVLPPFLKRLLPLPTDIQPKLDSWDPLADSKHRIEDTSFDIVLAGPSTGAAHLRAPVRVLPPDYAAWAVSETSEGNLLDLRLLIAKWVTPKAPSIAKLLEETKAGHTGDVIRDLQPVYEYLANMDIRYDMSRIAYGAEMEFRYQRVRPPFVTLACRRMNCIDGSVLFASCAEALGYRPAVVFVPGHAFVAFLGEGSLAAITRMAFLETTELCSGREGGPATYLTAVMAGRAEFEEHRDYLVPSEGAKTYRIQGLQAHRIIPIELARQHNLFPSPEHIG